MSEKLATLFVKRNADGLMRRYRDDWSWHEADDDHANPDFVWCDGNYACDCNRHLFFCRAANEDEDRDNVHCGQTLYDVKLVDQEGNVLYEDGEWPDAALR